MKSSKILPILGFFLVLMIGFAPTTSSAKISDVNVLFDISHGAQHDDASALAATLKAEGAAFDDSASAPVAANNVLLLAGFGGYNDSQTKTVTDWFNAKDEPRLIWVAGDSDFGGYFQASGSNALLKSLDAHLRLDAGAVEDLVNNDDAAYRVAVQTPVADGSMNKIITNGVSSVIMHGPTAVLGYDSKIVDLRSESINNVEVIMKSSNKSDALDQDLSLTEFDYYSSTAGSATNGSYPMMAIEKVQDNKFIIVSGEAIFTNYKSMYNTTSEQGGFDNPDAWNGGKVDGKTLVDNLFNFFADNMIVSTSSGTVSTSKSNGLPITIAPIFLGLALIPIVRKLRK